MNNLEPRQMHGVLGQGPYRPTIRNSFENQSLMRQLPDTLISTSLYPVLLRILRRDEIRPVRQYQKKFHIAHTSSPTRLRCCAHSATDHYGRSRLRSRHKYRGPAKAYPRRLSCQTSIYRRSELEGKYVPHDSVIATKCDNVRPDETATSLAA